MKPEPTNLRMALTLVKRGLRVFPCKPNSKAPATEHGCLDASNDPKVVRRMFNRDDLNVAIATGPEIWFLDLDGKEGVRAFWELAATHEPLPRTIKVFTPGGGLHFGFLPNGIEIRNKTKINGLPIDCRGTSGYVVTSPSIHPNGGRYLFDDGSSGEVEWYPDLQLHYASETPIAEAPKWVLEFVTSRTRKASTSASSKPGARSVVGTAVETLSTAAGAGEGQRHDRALELIGREIGFGTSKPEVLRLALAWGASCSPPMDEAETERIVEDLTARHTSKPAADLSRIVSSGKRSAKVVKQVETAPQPAVAQDQDGEGPPEFEPFPVEALPEPIRTYVVQGAAALGCEPSFIAVPIIPALAAAVGNARVVRLKRSWFEPLVFWTVTIAPSGSLKSPAFDLAVRPLQQRQEIKFSEYAGALAEFQRDQALYDADLATWKKEGRKKGQPAPEAPIEPHAERLLCSDTTVEALAVLLEQNPRGLLVARDELSGWLSSFDAYKSARGADVPLWLTMHRAGPLTVDRKSGRRLIHVPKAAVSICGTTQPETLAMSLGGRYDGEEGSREHFSNGLAARLLMTEPPRIPKRWTDADIPDGTALAVDAVFERLLALDLPIDDFGRLEPIAVPLTPEAQRRFVEFYDAHAQEQVTLGPDLAAAWSKLEGYAARFALLVHLVRDAAGDPTLRDPGAVDLESLDAGISLSRWFGDEAARIYATIGASGGDSKDSRQTRQRSRLVEWIRTKGGAVTVRELTRGPRQFRGDPEAAETALRDLAETGVGSWDSSPTTDQGGRPTRVFRLANAGDETLVSGRGDSGDGDETIENTGKSEVVSPSPLSPVVKSEVSSPEPNEPEVTDCNHRDPETWVRRDGKAFCAKCDKFMGRLRNG